MATVTGKRDSVEGELLRRALDDGGFPECGDAYPVHLAGDDPASWSDDPDGRVLLVSCDRHLEHGAWGFLARGAEDVISWMGGETIEVVLARLQRWREVDQLLSSRAVAAQGSGKVGV